MAAVTRKGDPDVAHCSTPFRVGSSSDVFVNGLPVSREGDNNTTHLLPGGDGCPSHSTVITKGSSSVFINGSGCGRVGDPTGCTSVAGGSPNVFAGG